MVRINSVFNIKNGAAAADAPTRWTCGEKRGAVLRPTEIYNWFSFPEFKTGKNGRRAVPSSARGGYESGPRRDPPSDVQGKSDDPPEMAKSRPVFPISKNMTAPVQFFIMADWILLFFICNSSIFRCCYIIHLGNSIPISIFTRFPINSADFPLKKPVL